MGPGAQEYVDSYPLQYSAFDYGVLMVVPCVPLHFWAPEDSAGIDTLDAGLVCKVFGLVLPMAMEGRWTAHGQLVLAGSNNWAQA